MGLFLLTQSLLALKNKVNFEHEADWLKIRAQSSLVDVQPGYPEHIRYISLSFPDVSGIAMTTNNNLYWRTP